MQQALEAMSASQLVATSSREANALWPNRARLAALLAQLDTVAPNNQACAYHAGRCWELVGEGARAVECFRQCVALGGDVAAEWALARVRVWYHTE